MASITRATGTKRCFLHHDIEQRESGREYLKKKRKERKKAREPEMGGERESTGRKKIVKK